MVHAGDISIRAARARRRGACRHSGDPQRPYLFTTDLLGGPIYANWQAGNTWSWSTQQGTDAYEAPGTAVAVQDGPALPPRPYVFYWSKASDANLPGHLMLNWWG